MKIGPAMALRRRSDKRLTAQDVFAEVVHMPMQLPGATVRLDSDSLADQRQRPATGEINAGELYHENSKLFPAIAGSIRASRVDAAGLRRDFVSRRAMLARGPEPAWPPSPLQDLLVATVAATGLPLFYALQLRVAHAGAVGLYEPLSGTFEVTRRLEDADWNRIVTALSVVDARAIAPPPLATVFVSASLARNEILYGRRGYRRTLIEVGQLVQQLVAACAAGQLPCVVSLEFTDRSLNDLLDLDGVEESVFAVLEIGGANAG